MADEIGPRITSLDAAAEELRHLLSEAVACRMRANGGVAVEVSGGWDSSTVATVADELERTGRVGPFELLTHTFPGMACDESEYTRAVEAQLGRDAIRLEHPQYNVESFTAEMKLLRHPFPRAPGRDIPISMARVILSGHGGNETLGGFLEGPRDFAGHLAARHPKNAVRALRATVNPFYRPLLPRRWRAARMQAMKPWLEPDLVRRVRLGERLAAGEPLPRSGTRRQRKLIALLTRSWMVVGGSIFGGLTTGRHPQVRHPCMDLRLVRLALACGEDVVGTRTTQPRRLHAHAYATALPAIVKTRWNGADFSELFEESVRTIRTPRSSVPKLMARRWVTGRAFDERMLQDPLVLWNSFFMYALESWLEIEDNR